jgi:hypothetical protein
MKGLPKRKGDNDYLDIIKLKLRRKWLVDDSVETIRNQREMIFEEFRVISESCHVCSKAGIISSIHILTDRNILKTGILLS